MAYAYHRHTDDTDHLINSSMNAVLIHTEDAPRIDDLRASRRWFDEMCGLAEQGEHVDRAHTAQQRAMAEIAAGEGEVIYV